LTTYQVGNLYACRANNFQRPSCFSQTCSTPTRAELALPSLSISAEKDVAGNGVVSDDVMDL
jgi:hypothetical protein